MSEKTVFQNLSAKKKLEHLWNYYRFPLLAVLVCAGLTLSLLRTLARKNEPLMNVIMVDSNVNGHSDACAFNDFLESCGIEPYEGAVALNTNISFYSEAEIHQLSNEMERNSAVLENMNKQQILFTLMAAGSTDLFFGKGDVFLDYAKEGLLLDLSEVLSPELLAQYTDRLIYCEEDGRQYPCAVLLTDNPWLVENHFYAECCFGILKQSPHPELAAHFAEFLLNR